MHTNRIAKIRIIHSLLFLLLTYLELLPLHRYKFCIELNVCTEYNN